MDFYTLRQLIVKEKIDEAITELSSILIGKDNYKDHLSRVIEYSSRLYKAKKELDLQVIDNKDYTLEVNRIGFSIISLIDDLEYDVIEKPLIEELEVVKRRKNREFKRVSRAISLAEVGIWEWTKTHEYHSPSWKKMLGYTEEQLPINAISTWEGLLHPEDRDKAREDFNLFLERKRANYDTLFRLLCDDGQFKWIRSKAKITKKADDGTVKRILGVHLDWSYVMNEIQKQKALVSTVTEYKKDIEFLLKERSTIVNNLQNAMPLQRGILDKIIAFFDSLDPETKEKISPLLHNIYEMEHIMSITNDAMLPESRTVSYIEKDFHLKNTLEHVAIRLRKMFKVDNRQLLAIDDTLVENFILKGYFEQLRGLIYWLLKFVYRNTVSSPLILKVEEITTQQDVSEKTIENNDIKLKFYIITNDYDKVSSSKLLSLKKFLQTDDYRDDFIEREVNYGLRQIKNILHLIDAKLEINIDAPSNVNGLELRITFSK